jgi:XTP/dITP diphosphohydrolase
MTNDRTILVGTNNAHKVGEIAALLAPAGLRVTTPRELGIAEEPIEDGATFEENALIKARFSAGRSGLPALADDSGLIVDALDGRPGVYSSRYAPTDAERIARLLDELKDVPEGRRTARFVCAAAFVVPGEAPTNKVGQASRLTEQQPLLSRDRTGRAPAPHAVSDETGGTPVLLWGEWVRIGTCGGRIAHSPRGANGFGYDPVFLVADLGFAKTMAELSPDEKNRLSHRARAFAAMLEVLHSPS